MPTTYVEGVDLEERPQQSSVNPKDVVGSALSSVKNKISSLLPLLLSWYILVVGRSNPEEDNSS
jgi:hypothetical protein